MSTSTPPVAVARAAAHGLALRRAYNRGGTAVGVARARDLSNRRPVSERTLRRMRSYFARHAVDARAAGWGKDSAGWIAWLLWGGDAGRAWAQQLLGAHVTRYAAAERENPQRRRNADVRTSVKLVPDARLGLLYRVTVDASALGLGIWTRTTGTKPAAKKAAADLAREARKAAAAELHYFTPSAAWRRSST